MPLAAFWPTAPTTPSEYANGLPSADAGRPSRQILRGNTCTYDETTYRGCNVVKRVLYRLKDFRRIATRYDKRADNFLSAIFLVVTVTWWAN